MHGLIFETSVWLLAGSTRLISSSKKDRNWLNNLKRPHATCTQSHWKTQHNQTQTARFCYHLPIHIRCSLSSKDKNTIETSSLFIQRSLTQTAKMQPTRLPARTKKTNQIALPHAEVSPRTQQYQTIQFHSTKLNKFPQRSNAQLSRPTNKRNVNWKNQLTNTHLIKQNKFTIQRLGVLL